MEENSDTGQYIFPQSYSIQYIAEKEAVVGSLDLSGLVVVLDDSRFRGIGNGGEVARYMGRLMLAHDFSRKIVNLPFTVGNSSGPNKQFSFISINGLDAELAQVRAYVEAAWIERKPLFLQYTRRYKFPCLTCPNSMSIWIVPTKIFRFLSR